MRFELSQSFDEYLAAGESTLNELLSENGDLVRSLRKFGDIYTGSLLSGEQSLDPVSATLIVNAYMAWLAAVRMALTSQSGIIFPTLRAALENVCYAFLISRNPEFGNIWINRHKGSEEKRLSRKVFGPAVAKAAEGLNHIQLGSGELILEAYEGAIDYGAHPNPKAMLDHLRLMPDQSNEFQRVSVMGIHGPNQTATYRGLVACLDFGLVIAIVIVRTFPKACKEIQNSLNEMNALKEEVTANYVEFPI